MRHPHCAQLCRCYSPFSLPVWMAPSLMFYGPATVTGLVISLLPLMSSIQRGPSKAGRVADFLLTLPSTACYPGGRRLTVRDDPAQPSPPQPQHGPAEPWGLTSKPGLPLAGPEDGGREPTPRPRGMPGIVPTPGLGPALCAPDRSQRERPY